MILRLGYIFDMTVRDFEFLLLSVIVVLVVICILLNGSRTFLRKHPTSGAIPRSWMVTNTTNGHFRDAIRFITWKTSCEPNICERG